MRIRRVSSHRPLSFSLSRFTSALALAAAFGMSQSARAQLSWDPGTDGDGLIGGTGVWNLSNLFWDPTGLDPVTPNNVAWPNLVTSSAIFGGTAGTVTIDNAGTGVQANSLVFNVTGYTIASAAAGDVLSLVGTNPSITVTNALDTATISAALAPNASTLSFGGPGTLVLQTASGRTGTTTVTGGNLVAENVGALGTGNVTVGAGASVTSAHNAAAQNFAANVTLNGGTFRQNQAQQLNFAAGKALTIGVSGGTVDVSGAAGAGSKVFLDAEQLLGAGTVTKTGVGTLQLSKANTGFTGNAVINGGFVEAQNAQSLGTTPGTVTVGGTGEFVVSSLNWTGPIVAQAGGAISGDNGNSTFSGPITASGQFSARARDFFSTGTARTLTISGAISGSGGLIAQGPTAGTGRVLVTGNNSAWTGALQVDPNTQAVATVGFGAGATTSLPSGDLTLNGGRLTITPSIGTGLTTTAGVSGRWVNYGATAINDTFATPWFVNTAATTTSPTIDFANLAGIDTTTGLPGAGALPQGVGLAATTAFIDRFAVVYNGLLNINTGGNYTFTMPSDDGSSLFIDGQQVIANEGGHGIGTIGTGSVALSSGLHQITLKNTNGGTGGGIQLAYQGPDQPTAPTTGGTGVTNMAVTGVTALTNVTGGLTYNLNNTITVPNQAAATNTTLDTSGFDTISNGAITVGDNGNLIFASATSNSFTQIGAVSLGANAGLSSSGQAVTVPVTSTLTPANVTITGNVTLNGNANLNADPTGRLVLNNVITDGAGSFGITKNNGAGTVTLGGTSANTFDGAFNVAQGTLLLNKPAGVNAIGAGGLNLDTSIATGAAAIDYAVVRLAANEQIADSSILNVLTHNTVGYGVTLDLNNFTETVGALNLRGATTNMGRIVTGPTGKLVVNGNITIANNRNAAGNTGREALITGVAPATNALNLFSPGNGTLDLGGATRDISVTSTVTQANTDGTIDTIITNGGINRTGGQRLVLNGSNPIIGRNSTFAGGITVNDGVLRGGGIGAQTSSAFGTGTLTINKGLTTASGGIAAGGATVELRNNGAGVNTAQGGTVGGVSIGQAVANTITYGNNVTIAATVPEAGFDVNNYPQLQNGATLTGSGGTMVFGTLTTGAAAQVDVTGGNNYALRFNGLALGGPLTVKPTTGNLQLNNIGTAAANNIISAAGTTGNLIIGGNGVGYTGTINLGGGGTLRLAPAVGVVNNLLGGATITGGTTTSTLGISPTVEGGSISGAGAIQGGLTAKFYQTNAAQVINTSTAYNLIPSGVTTINFLGDGSITNRPPTVTGTSFTNDIMVASGLLNITSAGQYTFQTFVDDESQLVIDGIPIVSVNSGAGGTGLVHSPVSAPISLSAGFHTITFKVSNQGGGGGFGVSYSGADSGGVMAPIPSSALYRSTGFTNVANSGVNQTIAAGTFTLDGGGTDLDGGINDLTFTGAGTLAVTNGLSTVASPNGTGVMTVSGTTSYGANNITFNTTSVLGLLGDVSGSGTITKSGAGTVILSGAKTFTGALNITAGGVQVTDPSSLGTAAGGTTVTAGAVLDLNGVALGAEPLSLAGAGVTNVTPAALWNSSSSAASASGPITLTAATTIGGLGDITLSGSQTGNFALTKIGPNTVTLSGASTNTAAITVSNGFLKVNNATALGTTAGNTVVSSGAVLDLNGFSLSEPLNINGAGTTNFGSMNSLGALINAGAAVTQTGAITLAGASSIGSNSLGAGGDITITAAIAGGQNLTKVGGNTLTLTGASTAPNAMNVNFGTVILSGAGTMTGGNWTVNPTATVTLDNNVGANTNNRLGARAFTLTGGNLNILGNSAAATGEALGANNFTVNSNNGVVTLTPSAGFGTTLSSTNALVRSNNGTVLFRATNLGNTPGANTGTILFGSIPMVGQQGGAGSKNRGIIPWALVDQSATGSGTSFAAHVGGSGIQVLNPLSEYDVDTVTGPNNIMVTGAPFSGPAGNTLVNSITLNGGGLTLGAGDSWQVDSGGILAVSSGTIGGGSLNAGIAGTNNLREYVVMTPGSGTTLTINSVMASSIPGINAFGPNASPNVMNRLGLTKAGNGTLVLGAQNTFAGTTRLNNGTTMLAGGENTILYPVASAPALGATGATLNAANLVVNAGATLDLNGNNQRIGGLASNLAAGSSALPGQGGVITNNSAASAATLYISQGASFTVPTSINAGTAVGAKALNVQRDGGNTLTLTAPNTYTGTTVLNGGLTVLQDGATLSGTSSITINRAALRIDDSQTIQTLNRISPTTPITLNGGALDFVGRGGGTQNSYTLGTVTVGSGTGLIQADMNATINANSAGDLKVTIGNLARTGVGSQVFFDFIQRNSQPVGDNPRYYISQLNGGALPAPGTMLPAWITIGGFNPASIAGGTSGTVNEIRQNTTDFAQYDPATGLRAVLYTSTFAPGNNVNVGSNTSLPVGGAIVNSLRIEGASTLIFNNAGYDTLNVQSGGVLSAFNAGANNKAIGITANAGNLTAGGINPGGPRELFIYNGAQTLTVNARIINNPTDGSVITPVFSGHGLGGTITLTGSNTYTGTTYVNGVNLVLNNTVGGLAITGDMIVSGGTSNGSDSQNPNNQAVTLNASNQIAPTANVTLNGGTLLNLNNNSNTLASLTFAADGGSFNNQGPAVSTGTGTLTLTGGVTATTLNQATTIPGMQGNLALPAGAHAFNIGTFLAAPNQVGFVLNSALSGVGSIEKNGPGILGIGGVSTTYTGTVNVNSGSLQFTSNNASLGAGGVNLPAGITLSAGGFVGTVGSLSGTGTVTSTFGGLASNGGRVNIGANNADSSFGGLVTGVVAIGKVGSGNFSLTNTANDYSGGTLINGGTFTLAGTGLNTTGTGVVSVNNTGTLAGSGNIVGGLSLNAGSSVSFALPATPGAAPINTVSAGVTSLGQSTFNFTGSPGVGVYPLINYGGTALNANQMAGMKIGTTPAGGGLLYGLVNNAAGTSVDLSVETVHATQTWTGAVNGTWDVGTTANFGGTFTNNNQVVFNDNGANRNISGPAVNPQAITVNNPATTTFVSKDYTIANNIGGSLAGGLVKSGTGTLRLTGANTFGGGVIAINGGTLRASVNSTASGLGSAPVTIGDGATLQLDPTANTSTQGITGRYFHQQSNANTLANMHFQLPAIATQTDLTSGSFNINWAPTNRPADGVVGLSTGGSWESFGVQFVGKLDAPATGPYSFFTSSDDATRVFIDGVQINNNDGGKGTLEGGFSTFLTAGLHDVRFDYLQGTGGAQARLGWQGPGIAKNDIPSSALFAAENVAGGFADNNILVGTNITVAGNSTLDLSGRNFTGVQLGTVNIPAGNTLNATGNSGKLLRAASTVLNGGTATINATVDVNPGQLTDGGVATTLLKQGNGRLVLDNTNPVNTSQANILSSGTVIEVQGGKLAVVGQNTGALPLNSSNPLGSAAIRLNGGNLSLETKQGTVTFDNAITVSKNATIEQQASSNLAITLGSGSNGIAIAGGSTLTFDLFGGTRGTTNTGAQNANQLTAGANITVAGAITGTGNLAFRSTQTAMGQYPVYGSAVLNANNTIAGTTTLNGGFASQGVTNPLIVTLNGQGRLSGTTGITINAAQLTVDNSATINSGRINATTPAPLTLRAGTFQMLTAGGASSETLGAITSDAGFNRIIIANNPNNNVTSTITGSSLVRNNNSIVQFQGQRLGLAADANNASTQIKFTTAPTLTGGGGAAGTATISILPYAFAASNPGTNPPTYFPVTYDATLGIRPISAANETVAIGGAAAGVNARSSNGANFTTTGTTNAINSYVIDNSTNAAITGTYDTNEINLSNAAGLLMFTATNGTQSGITINGSSPGINFGTVEGKIVVATTAGVTVSIPVKGSQGLTIAGTNNINGNALGTTPTVGGTLTLTTDNSANLTGTITLNGRLVINNTTTDTPLGNANNPIQFGGGALVFANANTTVASTRTVTMLPNTFGVLDTNGNTQTVAGPITGSGGLVKVGGGTLQLTNAANDYSGTTTVFQGNLVTSTGPQGNLILQGTATATGGNNIALSNATFAQGTDGTYAGSISGIGSVTINNTSATPITITLGDADDATKGVNTYAGGTTFTNTNAVTLRGTTSSLVGGIVTQANDAIVYNQNFDGTAGSVISGSASVTKSGTGKMTVVNNNTYSGSTTISGGTLSISSSGNLGDAGLTNTVAISNGATLQATASVDLGAARTVAIGGGGAKFDVPDVSHNLTISAGISGSAGDSLTKAGLGKVTLSAPNNYAGVTNVNAGTLAVAATGSIGSSAGVNVAGDANFDVSALVAGYTVPGGAFLANNGTVTGDVASGGTVSGSGRITGDLVMNSGGILSPGNSPGNFTVDGLATFNTGSTFSLELTGGVAGSQYDTLTISSSGGVTITGGQLTLSLAYIPANGQQFVVINNLSGAQIGGAFANLPDGGIITGTFNSIAFDFVADYQGGDGNDLVLTVPEPTTATAMLAGLGLCAGLRRFRRRSASV